MQSPLQFPQRKLNYIMDPDLKAAVQVALDLGMPLLVTGEPGTGKTRLAEHVATQFQPTPAELLIFNTKTTSKSQDLLYQYNALSHFRDAQTAQAGQAPNPLQYVHFQALGQAILGAKEQQYVVLIDEIDKAPRDFPNDVLFEFENLSFRIEEATAKEVKDWADTQKWQALVNAQGFISMPDQARRPVLILTSNSEKNLPDAFLRRCVYYHIPFPPREKLAEIVQKNAELGDHFTDKMLSDAIDHFLQIRQLGLRKKPATAELLAWIHLLQRDRLNVDYILSGSDDQLKEKIRHTYTVLVKNQDDREAVVQQLAR